MASTVVAYVCPLCESTQSTLSEWFSHLGASHSSDPSFLVTCGIDGCKCIYSKFSALKTHIYRHHKARIQEKSRVVPTSQIFTPSDDNTGGYPFEHQQTSSNTQEESSGFETGTGYSCTGIDVKRNSGLFLLELKESKGLSQVALDTVIEGCDRLTEQCLTRIKQEISTKLLNQEDPHAVLHMVNETFNSYEKPFDMLRTKYQQEKFYVEELNMTQPELKPLGRQMFKLTGSGSTRKWTKVSEGSFYYIPLLSTLKTILSKKDVYREISSQKGSSDFVDFCDGSVYANHPLFATYPLALQIIAYFDELEVCNPLGSAAKVHKVGIFMFTIANIPPKFRSSLKCLYVFAVAKASDIKKFTPDAILEPFISDIKILSTDGISVTYSDQVVNYKGTLLAFLADNLASHAIGGFKESFSSTFRFCRTCLATHALASEAFLSEKFILRTPDRHKHQCELLQTGLASFHSTTYGVNRWAALGDIENFSVTNCLPHDIMHDLLEGVIPHELSLLLDHCISTKYFSLDYLNEKITTFDYGYSETSNKPARIELISSTSVKIRQKARQMWLLAKSLPLLVGHFIPVDDQHWECYCLLLEILDICTAHSCSENVVTYLKTIVEEHHYMFKTIYPRASIIPKMHFIIHYPEQILKFGPLIRSWTLRYEARLKLCKQVAKFGNFKNICYSIAQKSQRWLCWQLQGALYLSEKLEVGGASINVSCMEESVAIKHLISTKGIQISEEGTICHPSWVRYFNCTYKKNCIIVTNLKIFNKPVFGKVKDILVLPDNSVLFYVNILMTEHFDSHYHAYCVQESISCDLIELSTMEYPFVLHLYTNAYREDFNTYVVLKYGLNHM